MELGERLGSVDPQLMQQLVKTKKLFEAHSEHNYQVISCMATLGPSFKSSLSKALCPDDKICVAMGVRSVVAPTLNALFYALKGVYSALGSIGEVLLR